MDILEGVRQETYACLFSETDASGWRSTQNLRWSGAVKKCEKRWSIRQKGSHMRWEKLVDGHRASALHKNKEALRYQCDSFGSTGFLKFWRDWMDVGCIGWIYPVDLISNPLKCFENKRAVRNMGITGKTDQQHTQNFLTEVSIRHAHMIVNHTRR